MTDPMIMEKSWDELPNPKKVWIGERGSREEGLGRLVLLTPERVLEAAQTQIKTGIRVNLGWGLDKLEYACFNRQPCELKMVPLLDGVAFDDIYTMNPRESGLELYKSRKSHIPQSKAASGTALDTFPCLVKRAAASACSTAEPPRRKS